MTGKVSDNVEWFCGIGIPVGDLLFMNALVSGGEMSEETATSKNKEGGLLCDTPESMPCAETHIESTDVGQAVGLDDTPTSAEARRDSSEVLNSPKQHNRGRTLKGWDRSFYKK